MDAPDKKEFIFGSIFLLANRLQVLGDRWDSDITMKQWFLIVMIAQFKESPPTLSEVAEFMGSSRQNVKQLALKLQKRNFLCIEKDAKDSRALRLLLTEECQEFFLKRQEREQAFLAELYKGISETRLNEVYQGIYQLGENVFEMDEKSKGGKRI
ncbi:MarR family winged helix-turn-helix transcriptional regulator [Cellulosilyticum sp. I15G10I2]|uniref:MarR family winged helix-turn-helix transcriptional regulator n=1 Tax=Cellulosilyticum sp. I15G10I2 TaxID=1892843 RepID=UPI00085C79A6|nr:hypothetical protein [Cellulosilyticum sp. I15G10I2]